MTSEEYFDTLSKAKDFPSIPETVVRLTEALDNPDSGVDDVTGIVAQDPAISAKLIKISNSSFFGYKDKITTIHKAVSILGFNLIRQLIVTTSVVSSFQGSHRDFDRREFWQHCVGVGTCAKIVARMFGMSVNDSDELFTIGLLHDIGKLITEKYFPREFNDVLTILKKEDIYFWEAERRVLGLTHSEVGRWVAQLWNFDSLYVNIIAYHHSVEIGMEFLDDKNKIKLAIINLSDTVAKDKKIGSGGDYKKVPLPALTVKRLDLKREFVEGIVQELDHKLDRIGDFVNSII